ncbi:MAG: acetyltransferase [Rhodobacteraceae bacterium]|nr:acetyltransferase [Paracoccaceae bacterium]
MRERNWVSANRTARKWTRAELALRLAWGMAGPLFRWSPRIAWGWRRTILRAFGAKIGADVHIYPSVRIAMPWNLALGAQCAVGDRAILYALGKITIGPRATVSQGVHLCAGTHDLSQPSRPLVKSTIVIGADAWVAADAFVGPGVIVGDGAIVGARAVAMKDVEPDSVVAGNPARVIQPPRA